MKYLLTTAILILLLLASCGTGSESLKSTGQLPATEFPALDTLRATSLATDQEQTGSEAVQAASTSILDGNKLQLPSGSNFSSWGIWSFACGYDFPTQLSFVMEVPAGSEYWVAVSDYSSGRWSFSGPYTAGVAVDVDSGNRSPALNLHCAVLTAGGSTASVQKIVLTTDSGWEVLDLGIELKSNSLENLSAAWVDGQPAVAYVSPGGELRYLRASTPLGQSIFDWPASGSTVLDGITKLQDISLAVVDGKPCIAVISGEPDNWSMRFASSSTAAGFPQDWQEHDGPIDSGTNYAPMLSLADVGGRPAVAYVATSGELMYRRSKTADGTTAGDWDSAVAVEEIDEANEHIERPQLFVERGKPAVSYIGHSQQLYLRRSDSTSGAKLSDWLPRNTVGTWDTGDWEDHAHFILDGELCLMAYDDTFGSSSEDDFIHFFYGDGDEKQPGWEGHKVIDDISGSFHVALSAASVSGMPAACYKSDYGPELTYTFADPQSISYPHIWEHQVVNSELNHGQLLDSDLFENAEGEPSIIYSAYNNVDAHSLYFAFRREP